MNSNESKSKKIVEIPLDEFQDLVERLKKCEADKKKLLESIEYLNNQIDEYNRKFSKSESG